MSAIRSCEASLLSIQPATYAIDASDRDVFVFSSSANQKHSILVSTDDAISPTVSIVDAEDRVLKHVSVPSRSGVTLSFMASEQGQYFVYVDGTRSMPVGTYTISHFPGIPDGSFSSGLAGYGGIGGVGTGGRVTLSDLGSGEYAASFREQSPVSLSHTVHVSGDKPMLAFSYRRVAPGDGDEFQVRINGSTIWAVPLDQTDADFVCPDPLDLSDFAGDTVDIQFYLNSVGEANAKFELDNIVLHEALSIGPQIGVTDDNGEFTDRIGELPRTTIGTQSDRVTYWLSSSGDEPLRVSDFVIGGEDRDDFAVALKDAGGTTVDLVTATGELISGEAYTLEVTFQPGVKTTGNQRSASISFQTNDPEHSEVTLIMSGLANYAPAAMIDAYAVVENLELVVEADTGILANDIDADGDSLEAIQIGSPRYGTLHLASDGAFAYLPHANFNREDSFSYAVSDGVSKSDSATVVVMVQTQYPWYNGIKPLDISDDGDVTPLDALMVINDLNANGVHILALDRPRPLTAPFLDVSRDGQLTPFDALLVINYLNGGEGEGERSADSAVPATTRLQVVDTTAKELVGANLSAEKQSRETKGVDSRQSSNFLQTLDLLFAKLDEAQGTRTGESTVSHRDKPAGDLEVFLDGLLSGKADDEGVLAIADH